MKHLTPNRRTRMRKIAATLGVLMAVGLSAVPAGVAMANAPGVDTPPGDQVFDYDLCGQFVGYPHRCGPLFDPQGGGS